MADPTALRAAMERVRNAARVVFEENVVVRAADLRLLLAAAAQQERDAAELGALRELERAVRRYAISSHYGLILDALAALDALRATTGGQ